MKVKEIRELSEMELDKKLVELKQEIAIVKTVQRERELASDNK